MHLSRAFRHAGRFTASLLLLSGLMAGAAHAAKPVALEGELDVSIEDYAGGRSVTRHFLKTEHGRVELKFSRKPILLASGTRVRVRGEVQGAYLTLDSAQAGSVEALTTVLPNTLGEQKVAVILVNFQDDTTQPITPAAANTLVFSSVNNHFRESSFDQTWFSGQTIGYYTIPMSKGICDTYQLANLADQAATAAGVNLSGYNRKVYFFPKVDACGWNGLATVAGSNTSTFVNGAAAATLAVVGHELGHNYGLNHAHALDCDLSALGDTCRQSSYGDAADLMGNNRTGHFSAFAKEQLGWLNDGVSPPIFAATSTGRYVIEPYSSSSVGAKAVKVPGGTDSLGRKRWYYLEYRQPIGADAQLGSAGNLTKGVMVRLASEGDRDSIYQLDMHPGTSTTTLTEMSDGALDVGQSYTDAVANVTITLVSAFENAATIDVTVGGAPAPICVRAAPTLSLTGPTAAVAAGNTINYTLSLSNKDSSACTATTFNLAKSLPSGWTGTLAASTLSLSAGASGSTTLSVTSTATATAGSYGIGAGTSSSAGSVHTANASATYSVAAQNTLTETVGTNKTSYLRAETVAMSALVKNNGVPVSGASVKFTVTLPGGTTTVLNAITGSDGYARGSYKLGKGKTAIGSYQLRADATSGSSTATSSTSFSVL